MHQPDREPTRRPPRAPSQGRGVAAIGIVAAAGVLALASIDRVRPAAPGATIAAAAATAFPAPVRLGSGVADSDAPISGWVIDSTGAPIEGVTISVARGDDVHEAAARTDAEGAFRLGDLGRAEATLLLDGDAIFPSQVHWLGDDATARVLATRRAAIDAVVLAADGTPDAGAVVSLSDGSGQPPHTVVTGPDGRAHFADLQPGTYELWAEGAGAASPLARALRVGPSAADAGPIELRLAPATALSGRVVDAAGAPIPAALTLVPAPLEPPARRLDTDAAALEHAARRLDTDAAAPEHAPRRVETDAAGRFAVAALPRGRWQVEVDAPGYLAARDYVVDARDADAALTVELRRGARVAGEVVDARGQPVAGAVITLERRDQRRGAATLADRARDAARSLTSAALRWVHPLAGERHLPIRDSRRFGAARDGERPLECGRGHCGVDLGGQAQFGHVVHAASAGTLARVAPDGNGTAGRFVAVEHPGGLTTFYMHMDEVRADLEVGRPVRAGEPLGTLGATGVHHSEAHLHFALSQRAGGQTWFIDPEPMLERAVVLPADQAAASVPTLVATRRAASGFLAPLFDVARAPEPARVTTGADGRFSVDGLPPGRYVATAFHDELAPGSSRPVALRAGAAVDDLRIRLGWGVILYGRVLGPEGPVAGARVVADSGEGEAVRTLASAVAGADGRFALRPLSGRVTVRASAPGHGSAERVLTLAAAQVDERRRELDFDLAARDAELRGQIVDPSGFPVRAATVRIAAGPSGAGRQAVTDENGLFSIAGVAAGRYQVTVTSAAFPTLRAQLATGETAELAVPGGGSLRVELRDAHTGARLSGVTASARGPGNARARRVTDDRGIALFTALSPGRWTVDIDAADYVRARERFAVTAGSAPTVAALELRRGATLAGVVRDADGNRVAGARVEVGPAFAVSDQDGVFRIEDVPTGDVELVATAGELEASEPFTLHPGDEYVTLELTLE